MSVLERPRSIMSQGRDEGELEAENLPSVANGDLSIVDVRSNAPVPPGGRLSYEIDVETSSVDKEDNAHTCEDNGNIGWNYNVGIFPAWQCGNVAEDGCVTEEAGVQTHTIDVQAPPKTGHSGVDIFIEMPDQPRRFDSIQQRATVIQGASDEPVGEDPDVMTFAGGLLLMTDLNVSETVPEGGTVELDAEIFTSGVEAVNENTCRENGSPGWAYNLIIDPSWMEKRVVRNCISVEEGQLEHMFDLPAPRSPGEHRVNVSMELADPPDREFQTVTRSVEVESTRLFGTEELVVGSALIAVMNVRDE